MLRPLIVVIAALALVIPTATVEETAEDQTAVSALDATVTDGVLDVTGTAAFAGTEPFLIGDFGAPGTLGDAERYDAIGAQINEAYIAQPDPETGDLQFTLQMNSLPQPGALPEVVRYMWDFAVRGADGSTALLQWEAKFTDVVKDVAVRNRVPSSPSMHLSGDCVQEGNLITCSHIAVLDGAFDADAGTVTVTVPAEILEEQLGAPLAGASIVSATIFEGIVAIPSAVLSYGGTGYNLYHDHDYSIATKAVTLELVDADGASLAEGAATVDGEQFSGSLDVTDLPAGDYLLQATACYGDGCGTASVPVTLS